MTFAPEQQYGSDSVWRDPKRFFAEFLRDLGSCRELAWQLFLRNLKSRYRQSITGYVWAFVPPLAWTGLFAILRLQDPSRLEAQASYVAHVPVYAELASTINQWKHPLPSGQENTRGNADSACLNASSPLSWMKSLLLPIWVISSPPGPKLQFLYMGPSWICSRRALEVRYSAGLVSSKALPNMISLDRVRPKYLQFFT